MGFQIISTPQAAFLKAGFFGFQGSGKTRTASNLAIGLHKYIKSSKPVAFLDTETGSDYVLPFFQKHNIALAVDKTRTFKNLIDDLDAAVGQFDVIIVDSITHYWRELVKAYKSKRNQRFLDIRDWGPLKESWSEFTDRYVNNKIHIIMCGRAANIFEDVNDNDDDDMSGGKKKFKAVKVGTKMAAETESGYEPSLLVEMQKIMLGEEGKYLRRAAVIKERFGVIDSKDFDFSPEDDDDYVFKCFFPHIALLNLGGEHLGVDTSQNSESLFGAQGGGIYQRRRQMDILLEKINGELTIHLPGTGAQERKAKSVLGKEAFGTVSFKEIEQMRPERVQEGLTYLEFLLKRYVESDPQPASESDWKGWLKDARDGYAEYLLTLQQPAESPEAAGVDMKTPPAEDDMRF